MKNDQWSCHYHKYSNVASKKIINNNSKHISIFRYREQELSSPSRSASAGCWHQAEHEVMTFLVIKLNIKLSSPFSNSVNHQTSTSKVLVSCSAKMYCNVHQCDLLFVDYTFHFLENRQITLVDISISISLTCTHRRAWKICLKE